MVNFVKIMTTVTPINVVTADAAVTRPMIDGIESVELVTVVVLVSVVLVPVVLVPVVLVLVSVLVVVPVVLKQLLHLPLPPYLPLVLVVVVLWTISTAPKGTDQASFLSDLQVNGTQRSSQPSVRIFFPKWSAVPLEPRPRDRKAVYPWTNSLRPSN